MLKSLFVEYIEKFFPSLKTIIQKINGKRKGVTYLFKTMLTPEYSSDLKWESSTINSSIVAADVVSLDSSLPLKKRDSLQSASGTLPKIGMKMFLNEKQILDINIMKARGVPYSEIVAKLINDAERCATGVDERLEAIFLQGLSDGITLVQDADTVGTGIRVDYGYLPSHKFGVKIPWGNDGYVPITDIKNVMSAVSADQNVTMYWKMSTEVLNLIRNSTEGKQLAANYSGMVIVDLNNLPIPTQSRMIDALKDEFGASLDIELIDRVVRFEKNGKQTNVKPWNGNKIVFLPSNNVGSLTYGTPAEETNPVAGVLYSKVNSYTLISKYSKNDPLQEFTASQAMVIPVIKDVDLIYTLDITEAQVVNTTAESADTGDTKVTIWGTELTKATVINAIKALGVKIAVNASDDTVIKTINSLSNEQEDALKATLEVS